MKKILLILGVLVLFSMYAIAADNIATVCSSGCNSTAIQPLIDSITDASSSNTYEIQVSPGNYIENIAMKDYVSLVGTSGANLTTINGGNSGHVINGSSYTQVTGFTILNGTKGIYYNLKYSAYVSNNIFRNIANEDIILTSSQNSTISNNLMEGGTSAGVYTAGASRINITNNTIRDKYDNIPRYYSSIKLNGGSKLMVAYNLFFNNYHRWGGIVTIVGSNSVNVSFNTLAGNRGNAGFQSGSGHVFMNNIYADTTSAASLAIVSTNSYNLYYNATADNYGTDAINGSDPYFVNKSARDYRLACGSPALDSASDGTNRGYWQEDECICADVDNDGYGSPEDIVCSDNCPAIFNPDQSDYDGQDGGDVCDNCPVDSSDACETYTSYTAGANVDDSGGVIENPAKEMNITIPASAINTNASISLSKSTDTFLTSNVQGGGVYYMVYNYSLTNGSASSFSKDVVLSFYWGSYGLTAVQEGGLQVYRYEGGQWVPKTWTTKDIAANVITLNVTQFSDYAIGYEQQHGGPGAYPIPEFSTVGLVMIIVMFVLLMVYRKKKS